MPAAHPLTGGYILPSLVAAEMNAKFPLRLCRRLFFIFLIKTRFRPDPSLKKKPI
jgi:hypothetical protein